MLTDDLKRFKQRLETAKLQATTPQQRLSCTVLLAVVDGELRKLEASDAETDRQSQPEQHEGENGQ